MKTFSIEKTHFVKINDEILTKSMFRQLPIGSTITSVLLGLLNENMLGKSASDIENPSQNSLYEEVSKNLFIQVILGFVQVNKNEIIVLYESPDYNYLCREKIPIDRVALMRLSCDNLIQPETPRDWYISNFLCDCIINYILSTGNILLKD